MKFILFFNLICIVNAFSTGTEVPEKTSKILKSFHMYECSDKTVMEALNSGNPPVLAKMLKEYVCRFSADKTEAEIKDALEQRGYSMALSDERAEFGERLFPSAGDTSTPVEITAYVCTRCPYCRKIIPILFDAVTDGDLKGKASLRIRIFALKDHEYSIKGAKALIAAGEQDKFWDYFFSLYKKYDNINDNSFIKTASEFGLNIPEFKKSFNSAKTMEKLVEIKKEGFRNRVLATPTFFINKKRWRGLPDRLSVMQAAEEEFLRIKGELCSP
ncbi:MAG: DsbA family protein [Fibrobacterota bacterium]